jgi:hypothetical protein
MSVASAECHPTWCQSAECYGDKELLQCMYFRLNVNLLKVVAPKKHFRCGHKPDKKRTTFD